MLILPLELVALVVISFDFGAIVAPIHTITLIVNVWQSLVAYTTVDLSLGWVCK